MPFKAEPNDRRRRDFFDYVEQYIFYAMAGLLAWLCLSAVESKQQTSILLEKATATEHWMQVSAGNQEAMRKIVDSHEERLAQIETRLADHGWPIMTRENIRR